MLNLTCGCWFCCGFCGCCIGTIVDYQILIACCFDGYCCFAICNKAACAQFQIIFKACFLHIRGALFSNLSARNKAVLCPLNHYRCNILHIFSCITPCEGNFVVRITTRCTVFGLFSNRICRCIQLSIFAGIRCRVGSCAITFQCIGHCFVTLRLYSNQSTLFCINAVYSQIQSILITAIGGICNLCTIVIILEVNACCFCVCFRANGYLFDCAQICIQVLTLQTAEGQTVIISAFQ